MLLDLALIIPLLSRTQNKKAKKIHHLLKQSRITIHNPYAIKHEHPKMNN